MRQRPTVTLALFVVGLGGAHAALWSLGVSAHPWLLGAWWTAWGFPIAVAVANRRAGAALRIQGVACPSFHNDEKGRLRVTVTNHRAAAVADVDVSVYDVQVHGDLGPGQTDVFDLTLHGHARGRFDFPLVEVSASYPFGLFRCRSRERSPGDYVVYPEIETAAPPWPVAVSHPNRSEQAGERAVAVRDYRRGDPLRAIDWKASARLGQLAARPCESMWPVLHFRFEDVQQRGLERGLQRLAAWVVRADREGRTYALELDGATVPLGNGRAHRHACLSALAAFRQEIP